MTTLEDKEDSARSNELRFPSALVVLIVRRDCLVLKVLVLSSRVLVLAASESCSSLRLLEFPSRMPVLDMREDCIKLKALTLSAKKDCDKFKDLMFS